MRVSVGVETVEMRASKASKAREVTYPDGGLWRYFGDKIHDLIRRPRTDAWRDDHCERRVLSSGSVKSLEIGL